LIFFGILIDIIKLFFDIWRRSLFTKLPLHLHYFPKTKVSPRLLLKARRSPPTTFQTKNIAKTTFESSPPTLHYFPKKSIAKDTFESSPPLAAAPPLLSQKSIAKDTFAKKDRQDYFFRRATTERVHPM
jgi:hypothetical protein